MWEVSTPMAATCIVYLQGWHEPPWESNGSWTSDGKYFVFQTFRNGRIDLWAIREKADLFHRSTTSRCS